MLSDYTYFINTYTLFFKVRSQLAKNDRKKFNSVLIVDVHNRDIIDRFVRDRSAYIYSMFIPLIADSIVHFSPSASWRHESLSGRAS